MQIVSRLAYPSSETSARLSASGGPKEKKMYRAARSSSSFVKSFLLLLLLTLFEAFQNNQAGQFPQMIVFWKEKHIEKKRISSAS